MTLNQTSNTQQPACLTVLFLTEMWERFGFYIVQVLLIFYLTKVYHLSDLLSTGILGAFTAISYITPVIGGLLADRYLGFKHSIILGGLLLSGGYAMLALQNHDIFYLALATIAIGTGFFKPNISSYLGNFYEENDTRCERGYTLFYIGINIGIILATSTSGYILSYFGWKADFLFASLGLLIAIATFTFGLAALHNKGQLTPLKTKNQKMATRLNLFLIYLCTASAINLASLLIKNVSLANAVFLTGGVVVALILTLISLRAEKRDRGKMLTCLLLISLSVIFWALYYQLFFSLNLFIDRALDRTLFNHALPSPIFIALMPLFIMTFGSTIGLAWQKLQQINLNPTTNTKFALSLFCMAGGLFSLTTGTSFTNAAGLVNKEWVVTAYLLFALAELLLSPICIAMVIQLIPTQYTGIMMGAYLASIGFGAKLAGVIAGYAAIPSSIQDMKSIVTVYHHAFAVDTIIALGGGLVILATIPITRFLLSMDNTPIRG